MRALCLSPPQHIGVTCGDLASRAPHWALPHAEYVKRQKKKVDAKRKWSFPSCRRFCCTRTGRSSKGGVISSDEVCQETPSRATRCTGRLCRTLKTHLPGYVKPFYFRSFFLTSGCYSSTTVCLLLLNAALRRRSETASNGRTFPP